MGRSTKILAFGACLAGLCLTATAQEVTYTADSLMSAFGPNAKVSIRGRTITFAGTIAEITRSRLIFRSSTNDRVICEVVPTVNIGDPRYLIGNHVTVVGKVRGRGVLGNVTLDRCSPVVQSPQPVTDVPTVEILETPDEFPAIEHSDVMAEEMEAKAAVTAAAPIEEPAPAGPVRPVRVDPATNRADPPLPKRLPKAAETSSSPATQESGEPPKEPERPAEAGQNEAGSMNAYLKGVLHTFAALILGVGGIVTVAKLKPVLAAVFRRTPDTPPTEQMRRAALEKLLLKQQQKKKY